VTPVTRDVVVIGAGHNGLVAACYLARSGHDVLVLEAADAVGGMTWSSPLIPGAPSHVINPGALEVNFLRGSGIVEDLQLSCHGYGEIEVDPPYVAADPEGETLAMWRDPARTADELQRFSRADAETYLDLIRTIDGSLDALLPLIMANPVRPGVRNTLDAFRGAAANVRPVAKLGKLITAPAAEVLDERFRHPMIKGLIALLTGFIPLTQGGSAAVLLALGIVHRFGVARVVGGTQGLPDALARCCAASGGQIRTSAPVRHLIVDSGSVIGVQLASGEELRARAVLAACDPVQTLTRLLPAGTLADRADERVRRIPTANSGASVLKLDVALRGRVELPKHQARRSDGLDLRKPMLLAGELDSVVESFEAAAAGELRVPTPFISAVPTAVDPSQAPEEQDTFYLFLNYAPAEPTESWESYREAAGKSLLADAGLYYRGLEALEIGRHVQAWPDIEARTRATRGNVTHVDFSPSRAGMLRPARGFGGYRTPVPGLFLTGAGTHPTGGVAGVSGKLAAQSVRRSLRSGEQMKGLS
jgi:phytoene dehydrogenase-like protein